ncbi:dihydroxyacetone kinase family protein [Labrys wisconsinensis]|uniref:Dihydroxyacetone kinase n=1 Tax=Labrys wisconsinensis TaxID=425677 RepID=A0ABU0JE87_9HYPH|nr:dihydroxyacetone kinase family protein [Labrys wisconsinensis]MDQ0472585.1 dihydroxyacetone kinase [Labrys wisconsinensis]
MKKLINHPLEVVRDMLEGAVALAPGQALLADEAVVVQAGLPGPPQRAVAVISGGGSGHEPAHAGYVGDGMLTAAVAGDVFTSPSSDAVLAAIRATAGPAGAVLVVKNYTGDRLNFGLAAEMARAEGIPVEIVVVADDVALRDTVEESRRRGIAGTVLVHKVAGAAAASGAGLADVAGLARAAAGDIGSMGVALGSCTLPAVGRPSFSLEADEIELGLGIHGEPGVERTGMAGSAALVERLLTAIVADRSVSPGARVALLVNGLGATPPMELAIVARDALRGLEQRSIAVERAWCGTFLSALDMPGFSLSLMRLDDRRLQLLDARTDAPAWPGGGKLNPAPIVAVAPERDTSPRSADDGPSAPASPIRTAVMAAAQALIGAEAALTELDAKAGDGDLGASLARGAAAAMALPATAWTSPSTALVSLGHALRRAIAGSSGPFYATALLRAARQLSDVPDPAPGDWAAAFTSAVAAISDLGGAKPGDRTMIDALDPAAAAFRSAIAAGQAPGDAWRLAVAAAGAGRDATAGMQPRLGRASYLGARAVGIPDAGAAAVACWMEALGPHIR